MTSFPRDLTKEEHERSDLEPCLDLTVQILRRLQRNDPGVVHLRIHADDGIKGIGRALGGSIFLYRLDIVLTPEGKNAMLEELCRGLARNRCIQWLTVTMNFSHPAVDVFYILAPFFEHNHKLGAFEIRKMDANSPHAFFLASALKKCKNLQLAKFDLIIGKDDGVSDVAVAAVLDGLNLNNHKLGALYYYNSPMGMRGAAALARLVSSTGSNLVVLKLINNVLDEDCIHVLTAAISNNTSLASFTCSSTASRTDKAWRTFSSAVLSHPLCCLRLVRLQDNNIGDEGVSCLGNALTVNKTVTVFDIGGNPSITRDGWMAFLKSLKAPHSILESLDISYCEIDEESAIAIILALRNNVSLKTIYMMDENDFSDKMRTTLSGVLCDTSSIENTYFSNHSLRMLDVCLVNEENDYDSDSSFVGAVVNRLRQEDIKASLSMNKNDDKTQVARQKILRHHFSGERRDISLFATMPETMLPFVTGWIGCDNIGFSLMYAFIRSLPALIDAHNWLVVASAHGLQE